MSYFTTSNQIQTATINTRPPSTTYNNNIPSTITNPTPDVVQPIQNVKPTNISTANISVPASTSQITVTKTPAPTATSAPQPSTIESKPNYFLIGIGIISIVVVFILLKKYKKI